MITIEGITYREIPYPKGEDTPCKECQFYIDNGICDIENCPVKPGFILASVNKLHFYEKIGILDDVNYFDKLK